MLLYMLGTHPEAMYANWENAKMMHSLYRHWQSIPEVAIETVQVVLTFP